MAEHFKQLNALTEELRQIGQKVAHTKGGDYNDWVDYNRVKDQIVAEVERLYITGRLM